MKNQILVLALAGSFSVSAQAAITLFSENFDSYADGTLASAIPGVVVANIGAGDSLIVSTAQALSGMNSLRFVNDNLDTQPDVFFNFASVTPANAVNGLNLSFSFQKVGNSYNPNIWVMFGNQANTGFANGNIALQSNGLNNFFGDGNVPGFQGTVQGANWQTVNVAYTFTNNGTNITGYTGNFTTSGGAFSPSFSVTKTGITNITSIDSIRFQYRGDAGEVYIDNVSITAIPEPSTSALAALAALGFAFTRRRRA